MAPMSNAPSEAVEGGDFPRGDLLVTKAWFGIHKYTKKGVGKNSDGTDIQVPVMGASGKQATAVAAYVDLRNDEGVEFHQFYSIGDPARFTVAKDGSEVESGTLKTNCNYYQLLKALVNAGYPEDKLRDEAKIASLLVGLYAKWDQESEKRGDSSQLVLPQELHQFPWGEATRGAPTAPDVSVGSGGTTYSSTTTNAQIETSPAAAADEEVIAKVVDAAEQALVSQDSISRADLSMWIFSNCGADEKMAMMNGVMSEATTVALAEAGIGLEGEQLAKV